MLKPNNITYLGTTPAREQAYRLDYHGAPGNSYTVYMKLGRLRAPCGIAFRAIGPRQDYNDRQEIVYRHCDTWIDAYRAIHDYRNALIEMQGRMTK